MSFSFETPVWIAPKFILKSLLPLCFRCVCFMWLLSDLHALEVELWIHCFCTRPHQPFKSSDCYQANLWLHMKVSVKACFLATTFQALSLSYPRQNNRWWDLTLRPETLVFQVMTVTKKIHVPHPANCMIDLWIRSPQATLGGCFHTVLFSAGLSCYFLWCMDPHLGYF